VMPELPKASNNSTYAHTIILVGLPQSSKKTQLTVFRTFRERY
jgi:hypothetical protein